MRSFLGVIGLPAIGYAGGTEISPHLRLRDGFGLHAGVRPIKAYPNAPRRLADPRAANIDMVIPLESTEGLFYSAAAHGRSQIIGDQNDRETLRITRATTEKLHHYGFRLAEKRKSRGKARASRFIENEAPRVWCKAAVRMKCRPNNAVRQLQVLPD